MASNKDLKRDVASLKLTGINKVLFDAKQNRTSAFSTNQQVLPNYPVDRRTKLTNLKQAILNSGLKSGMTISFHHHFRSGDKTIRLVMEEIKALGIKDLTIAASSFTKAHDFLIDYIKEGYVTGLQASGCRDELGKFVSSGAAPTPIVIRSHGGRARAIEAGDLKIDVAFLAVSAADEMGNSNGTHGKSQCGSLGYAMVDAQYAAHTVIITDTLVPYPNESISISQIHVDDVVLVDEIGDSNGIMSGEIRLTSNPREEIIAQNIAKVVLNTDLFKEGFSMQMGTGGASLSAITPIKNAMVTRNIKAGFCLGGITGHQVRLQKEGFVGSLFDTQCFDLEAVNSIRENPHHHEISASMYANPHNKSPFTTKLDYVILSALEVDFNFNVNVITGSDGTIRGASGGHSDTAAGAKIAIVALPLMRGRLSCVVDRVQTIITPGSSVDVIVTDFGIVVNPARQDLIDQLTAANIPLTSLAALQKIAHQILGVPQPIQYDYNHVVGIVEYRDGSIIDLIYKKIEQ